MKKYETITGVVLAGGASSRMGRDKALLEIGGKPFLGHIVDALREIFTGTIIISDHGELYSFLDLPIYPDVIKRYGPLGGLHSAFVHTTTDRIFIVSCDVPLITSRMVRDIVEAPGNGDAVIMSSGRQIQPLFGVYSRSCLPLLECHLSRGQHSVTRFLQDIPNLRLVSLSPVNNAGQDELLNINTPRAYEQLLKSARWRATGASIP